VERILLNGMHHSDGVGHRSGNRQGCLRGTRRGVLQQLEDWLENEQGQRVFWLNGLAGTGKSTIAQTFAEITFADGKLGASFFCSRNFEDRSNIQAILPTLAFQLAYRYPAFRKLLLQILRANPGIGREKPCSQMEKLIVGPFQAMQTPTLIIIDALDECQDEEPASLLLSVLSRYVDKIPLVKFLITGRPEPRIRSGFRLELLQPHTDVLRLHDVERCSVDNDIKLFLKTRLMDVVRNRSNCDLAEDWPTSQDIDALCKKAAGLFIYASTVVKFIASECHPPDERLVLITSLPHDTSHEGKPGIDLLYTQVLGQAFHNMDQGFYMHLKSVLGAVLLVFHPLSIKTLSDLLSNCGTPPKIYSTLRALHSLLLIPDSMEDPVRIFHKSFPDFLTDPERCVDKQLFIDPPIHHGEILLACLDVMTGRLKRNICQLDDNVFLNEVEDLHTRRETYIGDTLEYACHFWINHLVRITTSSVDLEEVYKAIDKFFTTCFPFWIEVLCLTGNLNISVYALNDLHQWYLLVSEILSIYQSLSIFIPIQTGVSCNWTNDCQRFLLEHFDTIHHSPSQIYHSALPLSPPSWLHKYYSTELSPKVRVVKEPPAEWGACSRTVLLDNQGLALSYWNNTIAIGLRHGDIVILDAITGGKIAVLSKHPHCVRSLTFSSDGRSLVSGSYDKTVKLWDVQTGGVVKTFYGHTDQVNSVSISVDCCRIASGSLDCTIHLWNIQTGECYYTIKQEDVVYHVGFSPIDPQNIIYISGSKVLQQDVNGHQVHPAYDGSHIAFSPDHTQFVLCNREVITVQKSDSKVIVAEFHLANVYIAHCCFSPDGRLVAAAANNIAYVWDITTPNPHLIETFIGHTGNIKSLVFSSPSSLVSASLDKSVKFWQISTSSTDRVTTNPQSTSLSSAPILSVSLQAQAEIAISVDADEVVKVWNISTGLCKASFKTLPNPIIGTEMDAKLIDDRLIFAYYDNGMINLWDIGKGEHLKTLITFEKREHYGYRCDGLRISGDGSKIFLLNRGYIKAWFMWTWELVGEAKVELDRRQYLDSLCIDNSRVWIHSDSSSAQEGWDFGISDSSPVQFDPFTGRPHLDIISGASQQTDDPFWIKDTVAEKNVFQLSGRYANPRDVQWDGQYLVAGYESGEVLILDFDHMYSQ